MHNDEEEPEAPELELSLHLEPKEEKSDPLPAQKNAVVFALSILVLMLAGGALGGYMVNDGASGADLLLHGDDYNKTSSIQPALFDDKAGDYVSDDQRAIIDSRFMTYTAQLEPLDLDDDDIRQEFLEEQYLEPELKQNIIAQLDEGSMRVAPVILWDNFDQDGDIVTIQTSGVSLDIPIYNAPTTVMVPYTPGEPLVIYGMRDGGGGITAAIETASGPVPLPIMAVGQTIILPLL